MKKLPTPEAIARELKAIPAGHKESIAVKAVRRDREIIARMVEVNTTKRMDDYGDGWNAALAVLLQLLRPEEP